MAKHLMGNGLIKVGDDTKMPERDSNDFYPTPWGVIERAVQWTPWPVDRAGDIGAGSGRWGQVLRNRFPTALLTGFEKQEVREVNEVYDTWLQGDVLETLPLAHDFGNFDLLVGNPPFYLFGRTRVGKFFRTCHEALNGGGRLILFARSALLESAVRYKDVFSWWKPTYHIVLVDRVSFYPEGHSRCGDTNATAHSLFVWEKDFQWDGYTRTIWQAGIPNDDTYNGVHKGTNTWQDMLRLGVVKEE